MNAQREIQLLNSRITRLRWSVSIAILLMIPCGLMEAYFMIGDNVYDYMAIGSENGDLPTPILFHLGAVLLMGVAFFTAAIISLFAISQANRTLGLLSERNLKYTPGKSVGYWFIPFANVFYSRSIMKEILVGSAELLEMQPPKGLLDSWWGFYFLSSLLGFRADRIASLFESLGPESVVRIENGIGLLSTILCVLSGLAWIQIFLLVEQYLNGAAEHPRFTKREEESKRRNPGGPDANTQLLFR